MTKKRMKTKFGLAEYVDCPVENNEFRVGVVFKIEYLIGQRKIQYGVVIRTSGEKRYYTESDLYKLRVTKNGFIRLK